MSQKRCNAELLTHSGAVFTCELAEGHEDSFKYIRETYKVPARRGVCIRYTGGKEPMDGIIVSACYAYISAIMTDGHKRLFHPTWELEYHGAKR